MLDLETVELANAYGPYSHGTWVGHELVVGNEEALAGRGDFLIAQIRRAILDRFTVEQMRTMTLVDVGCYDGWLLCQLSDLPFRRMIGIEPRKKNIEKGQMIRRLLGIETRCEIRQGSIETVAETLNGEKADVVICVGLLHHLPSIAEGVARLYEICGHLLFLETLCLPKAIEDRRVRKALELKDLPYFFGDQGFGVTGYKLESGYYDGSAVGLSVVSLPSVATLRLFLHVQGFRNITVVADPDHYRRAVSGGWRNFSLACIAAEVGPRSDTADEVTEWIDKYEGGLIRTLLPTPVARALYERDNLDRQRVKLDSWLARVVYNSTAANGRTQYLWGCLRNCVVHDRYMLEILKNLRYAPRDKSALEYGKCLLAEHHDAESEQVLLGITRRLNADWRSVYRAFCLLAWLYKERGHLDRASRYIELCRIANPQFPEALLTSSVAEIRPTDVAAMEETIG